MFSAGALRERKRAETSDQGLLPTKIVTVLIVQFGLPSIGVDGPHCDRDTLLSCPSACSCILDLFGSPACDMF